MTNVAVIGAQWGDEGKGKVVDVLAPRFSCVVRFQGGNNAGHSVKFGQQEFALHLLPSGVLCASTVNLIAGGVVVDPRALCDEMDALAAKGFAIDCNRLKLSDRAHVVMPYHQILDQFRDAAPNQRRIGTTGKGIGPTYEWKAARRGIRFCDTLTQVDFVARLESELRLIHALYPHVRELMELDVETLMTRVWPSLERLAPYVTDGVEMLAGLIESKRPILFEGAQAVLLDIDFGTYPYVTSSNSSALGIPAGAGVPLHAVHSVVGITKAYTTRVGEGPFPTELDDDVGAELRRRGREFGTTTGRPRRCGWLDLVALRYARRLNGFDALALMKLDVLDACDQIMVCENYAVDGKRIDAFPASLDTLRRAKPIYRSLPGWCKDTSAIDHLDDLPAEALDFIAVIEDHVGCPIDLVSVGPDRGQTILREDGIFRDIDKRAV